VIALGREKYEVPVLFADKHWRGGDRFRRRVRSLSLLGVLAVSVATLLSPVSAEASFHEQIAIDAKAIALANTVTASPPGIMSIHYNPAGLSLLGDGSFISMGLTLPIVKKTSKFTADSNFQGFDGVYNADPLAGTQGTNTSGRMYVPFIGPVNTLLGPTLGFAIRKPGSKWTFAIGNYAPFAVGINHGQAGDPSRFGGQSVYQQHLIYAAPAVSYQVNKRLSVGLSVGFGQTAMGAHLDMRSPNDLVGMTKILGDATQGMEIPLVSEIFFRPPWFGGGISPYDRLATADIRLRDDFSPSYNLGLLWSPLDWLTLGASYQSAIKVNMQGSYRIQYSEAWQRMVNWFGSTPTLLIISGMLGLPHQAVPEQRGIVSEKMEFPQMVNLGLKLKPFDRLSLLGDLHWANWSVIKQDRFIFDQDIQLLQFVKVLGYTGGNRDLVMTRNFRDTWNWGVGMEFQLLDWLSLRLGYERRESSTRTHYYDLLYAIPNLDSYGAGFGIQMENGTKIDFGFGYLVDRGYKVQDNGSVNLNTTNFTKPVYNPYAGLNYEQDTKVYLASMKMTMPYGLVTNWVSHQLDWGRKLFGKLNPFG
jgi:long-subunit fatty acid transport protein